MGNKIFPPYVEARHREGLLGAYFDCFFNWMQDRGYKCSTMRNYIQCVTSFGNYLHQKGICSIHQLEGASGQRLLVAYKRYCNRRRRYQWRKICALKLYLKVLVQAGIFRNSPLPKNTLLFSETERYITFLRDQKGLNEETISQHIRLAEKFLRFIGCQKDTSFIPSFGIVDVDKFIEQQASRLCRSFQHPLRSALRSFIRFLYQSQKIQTDLSCLIINPRRYKLQSLPSVLDWAEIQRILDSVDRSTKIGLRDYAILILLATYGLRAGEVGNLKLNDIDWRKETIHITPRKAGKDLWLPLTPQAGKAILKYLKYGRPSSKSREVFLSDHAPLRPLDSNAIGMAIRPYIKLAGLNPPRFGAHLFRHSFATHLNRKGVPLKQISDMLGHRDSKTTNIYTKTATEQLREVALAIPEVR